MAPDRRDSFVENLAAAAVVGVIALLLAIAASLAETRSEAAERSAISELAGRHVAAKASVVNDPAFSRIYRVEGKSPAQYGAVAAIRTKDGVALFAAVFSPDGRLDAARFLGATARRLPQSRPGWFADFVDKGGETGYPSARTEARDPSAVSGATESFVDTSSVLDRLSRRIRTIAKERA